MVCNHKIKKVKQSLFKTRASDGIKVAGHRGSMPLLSGGFYIIQQQ